MTDQNENKNKNEMEDDSSSLEHKSKRNVVEWIFIFIFWILFVSGLNLYILEAVANGTWSSWSLRVPGIVPDRIVFFSRLTLKFSCYFDTGAVALLFSVPLDTKPAGRTP